MASFASALVSPRVRALLRSAAALASAAQTSMRRMPRSRTEIRSQRPMK